MQHVIIARTKATAAALRASLQAFSRAPLDDRALAVFVLSDLRDGDAAGVSLYRTIAAGLRETCESAQRGSAVVAVVDAMRPSHLNAISPGADWNGLIALLVLTFPDVHWRFGALIGPPDPSFAPIAPRHTLANEVCASPREPLFDASGLRNYVRHRTNTALALAKEDLRLPTRSETAASIDEEQAFAHWHAYCAYRYGYRADAVTTVALMQELFSSNSKPHGYSFLFEDMSLNFPDLTAKTRLLELDERARHFPALNSHDPALENSALRLLVTAGLPHANDNIIKRNIAHLHAKHASGRRGQILYKPTTGLFGFWRVVRPPDKFNLLEFIARQFGGQTRRPGNAPDYTWPPPMPNRWKHRYERVQRFGLSVLVFLRLASQPPATSSPGHGAPGKLQLVSDTMLHRARSIRANANDSAALVVGAVISCDAAEYVGSKTPNAALEALSLRHEFELAYECAFAGAEYHVDLRSRMQEIREETWQLAQWLDPKHAERAAANAEMRILSGLLRVLREATLFDEERACLTQLRHLHFTLWLDGFHIWKIPRVVTTPLRWLFIDPFVGYAEFLFKSFGRFLLSLLGWVAGLALFYEIAYNEPEAWKSWTEAFSTFFSAGAPVVHAGPEENDLPRAVAIVNALAILAGGLHMGVLISYLFSVISRRS